MAVFAKIALVVTLCSPGAPLPVDGACKDEVSQPMTWESGNVVEARQDWEDCKDQQQAYLLRPGEDARCQYTAIAGITRAD